MTTRHAIAAAVLDALATTTATTRSGRVGVVLRALERAGVALPPTITGEASAPVENPEWPIATTHDAPESGGGSSSPTAPALPAAVGPDDGGHPEAGGPPAVSAAQKGTATAHEGGRPSDQPGSIRPAERVGGPHREGRSAGGAAVEPPIPGRPAATPFRGDVYPNRESACRAAGVHVLRVRHVVTTEGLPFEAALERLAAEDEAKRAAAPAPEPCAPLPAPPPRPDALARVRAAAAAERCRTDLSDLTPRQRLAAFEAWKAGRQQGRRA